MFMLKLYGNEIVIGWFFFTPANIAGMLLWSDIMQMQPVES